MEDWKIINVYFSLSVMLDNMNKRIFGNNSGMNNCLAHWSFEHVHWFCSAITGFKCSYLTVLSLLFLCYSIQIYFCRLSYVMKQWNDLYNSFYWFKNSGIGVLEKSWLFCDWKKKNFWKIVPNCEQLDDWYESIKMENNFSLNTWKINSQEDLLFFFFAKLGICCNICYISKLFVIFCFNWFPNFSLFSFLKITFHSIIQLHFKHETYSKCSCIFFFITHCKYREKK